jgi:hypothetical protein
MSTLDLSEYYNDKPINKIYAIGGLENNESNYKTLNIDGTNYVVSDKFRMMLQDLILDWGAFLEIYNDKLEYSSLFDQIVKLLNIKENDTIRETLLPVIKEIYELPAEAHLACMLRQFMIYEPLSIAIHSLFTTIKHHYESIVKKFIDVRNDYITKHKLKAEPNDWKHLLDVWNDQNIQHNLESSSVILLFLNPPKGLKNEINFKIPGKEFVQLNKNLQSAIKKFIYPGFCPKVPHERLTKLLNFPINEFIEIITELNPSVTFPDYSKVEEEISKILNNKIEKPKIDHEFKLESPPLDLVKKADEDNTTEQTYSAKLQLIKWYVSKILEFRKELLPYGKKYEEYYEEVAKLIGSVVVVVKSEFLNWK